MKPTKLNSLRHCLCLGALLLLAGGLQSQAANTAYTTTTTAAGDWSSAANWTGGVAAAGAGNSAESGAAAITMTLDVPETLGVVETTTSGGGRTWTIDASGTVAMTFDNTGATATNPNGDHNAWLGSASSGAMVFQPNIIIQNTDLDIQQSGSTTPSGSVGVSSASTITATSARNLILIESEAKAGQKTFTINSGIGGAGSSFITISNIGPGSGTMVLSGPVGPNASVVEDSVVGTFNSNLELNNAANNYTGPTIITSGTLLLNVANAIPSVSSVSVAGAGTLSMGGHSDTIDGLSGAGTVDGISGTPTLTVGGNNSGGTFSGVIQNTAGTLSLVKTGTGTEILSGNNTYAGTTTINGGILGAGSSQPFGTATAAGSIVFGGGTLQYSAANQTDYSPRFSTAVNQPVSIDLAGQSVSFGTALSSSGGTLTVNDSVGSGRLTLTAAPTYTGNTTIKGGTLALTSGTLASPNLNLGAGGSFDVSAEGGTYSLGGENLNAAGTGTTVGSTAANLVGASGGTFDLGTQTLTLTWGGGSSGTDSTHPPLTVSQGALNFNGNSINLVVPGTALGLGVYTLITAPSITGTPPATAPVYTGGNGIVLGYQGVISVSGNSVILTVSASGATLGTWANDVNGNWSVAGNWSSNPKVPGNAGDAATLGVGSGLRTITLNVNESLGALALTNANSFVISGGNTLTLDNKGSGATVDVTGGTANAIQTAVALNDNAVVTVNANDALAISGNVNNTSAAKDLTFTGPGTLSLSGANNYGPSAGAVGTTMNGGGLLQVGNNSALGAGDVSVAGGSTLQAGAAVSLGNNLALAGTMTANNNGYNWTLGGVISGAGGITETGAGTLTLNGYNTYTGGTTVNAGVLGVSEDGVNAGSDPGNLGLVPSVATPDNVVLNGGDLLGNGTLTLSANRGIGIGLTSGTNGGTAFIDAANGAVFTLNGIIASAGNTGTNNLTVNSVAVNPGTVVLGGANLFKGVTVISNGILQLANPLALQNSTLNYNSGTLTFGAGITAATLGELTGTNLAQNLILTAVDSGAVTLTVGLGNVMTNYAGNLSGSGSLTGLGSGALTFSNATYTGATVANTTNGSLTIAGGTFGSSSSAMTVNQGTLNLSGSASATAGALNIAPNGGETGVSMNILGAASAVFTTANLGSAGNTAGHLTINTTGSVGLGAFIDYKDNGALGPNTGAGLIIDNGTVTATSVTIQDTGSGANMNITGGSLTIGNSSSSGDFIVGAVAESRGGFLTMSGGSLTYLGADGLLAGNASGDVAGVAFSGGTATLTGITLNSASSAIGSTATNTLTLSGGAALYLGNVGLVINNPAPGTNYASFGRGTVGAFANWSSVAPITLDSATTNATTFQTADITTVNPFNITLGGTLSGPGNLAVTGPGVLTLSGANTYSGNTTISNGTLFVNNPAASATGIGAVTVQTNGTLTGNGIVGGSVTVNQGGQTIPGGNNLLTVVGSLTYNAGAAANFVLSGAFNSGNDQIVLNGAGGVLSVNGTSVGINATNGYLDTTGDYLLITNQTGGVSGSFARTPVWIGSVPANAANFSIGTWGNYVVLHYSPVIIGTMAASPSPVAHDQVVTLTVNATSTGYTINPATGVAVNATAIGGPASLPLVASNGTSLFTNSLVVQPSTPLGQQTLTVTVADSGGNLNTAPLNLTVAGTGEVWNGAGSPVNTWATKANWVGGYQPGPGDWLTFDGTTQLTTDLETNYTISALTFDSTAGAFIITNAANTLTLTGGVTNNSAYAQTVAVPVALPAVQTFAATTGNLVFGGNISGAGGVNELGGNTLTLAGSNTFSGPLTINSGTLAVVGAGLLGGGTYAPSITNNGVLNYASSAAQTLSGVLSGSGVLTLNGAGSLALPAANTYTNNTTINNGVVVVQNSASFGTGNVYLNGGGIMISSNGFNAYSLANAFFFTNTSIIDMDHSTNAAALYGAWSGNGTIIISNLDWNIPGDNLETLTMGGNTATATMNAFSGKIIVTAMNADGLASQGTLRFNSGTTTYNTGSTNASFNLGTNPGDAVTLTSRDGGTINLGELTGGAGDVLLGSRTTAGTTIWSVGGLNTSTTFGGAISNYSTTNLSALTKVGAGTLTLTGTNNANSAANGPAGPTVISAGVLQIGDGGADGSLPGAYVTNNAILTFDQSNTYTATNIITGTGLLDTIGGGTLILSPLGAANTYSGGTVVYAGSLQVNGPLAGGPLTVNTGSLVVNSTIGNAAITVNSGSLTVSGTGAIGNGVTTVNGGTLTINANGVIGNTGSTTNLATVANGALTVNGLLDSSVLTILNGGVLAGGGTIGLGDTSVVTNQAGGNLYPGQGVSTAGTQLTVNGKVVLAAGSTTTLAVSHSHATSDRINAGAFYYGGALTVVTNAGDAPLQANDSFQLFNASFLISGSFANLTLPALGPGLGWATNLSSGSLLVVPTVNLNPTNLVYAVTNNVLTLSWPADHTGWRLLEQTNNLINGISANTNDWGTVPGSAATNSVPLTNNPALPDEFFRLVYP